MSPIPLGFWATAGAGTAAGAYELISTTILSSDTSTVSLSSIPATYKHLQVRLTARVSTASNNDALFFRCNNVSSADYAYHRMYGLSAAVNATYSTNAIYAYAANVPGNTSLANNYAASIIDIVDYASTDKYKTFKVFHGKRNESPIVDLTSGLMSIGSAISSITFLSSNNIKAGSRFSLYGIKGA